jgi:hypothetical protein
MADYVTSELIAAFGHQFDGLADSSAIDLLVTSASRLFDNLTGVSENFYAAASSDPVVYTTRTFYGNGTGYLPIDPYTALNPVTPVVIDPDYAYDVPTYIEQDGMLVIYGSYMDKRTGWTDGISVAVSANWGFAAVPADVQLACIAIAMQLWRTADPSFSIISGLEGAAAVRIRLPDIHQAVVESYRGKYSQEGLFA